MLSRNSATTLPPSGFATPPTSRDRLFSRRVSVNNSPPPLKRRRTESLLSPVSPDDLDASYIPRATNLPYLDCENYCTEEDCNHGGNTPSTSIPTIRLSPAKRSRKDCFLSSSPKEHVDQDLSDYGFETRIQDASTSSEEFDETPEIVDARSTPNIFRTSSLKSFRSKRPSMKFTRSFSLHVNLSLLNLKAASTNNDGRESCPLSSSSMSSIMPKRSSFISIRSSQDILSEEGDHSKEPNQRSSPVTTPLDYLSTMRFPDVAIGLSI